MIMTKCDQCGHEEENPGSDWAYGFANGPNISNGGMLWLHIYKGNAGSGIAPKGGDRKPYPRFDLCPGCIGPFMQEKFIRSGE